MGRAGWWSRQGMLRWHVGLLAVTVGLVSTSCGAETQSASDEELPATSAAGSRANPHGIDVDLYQGDIDWKGVNASGISFAFAKATEGATSDPRFAQNWSGMKEAGVTRGAYHFYDSSELPEAQAQLFIDTVTLESGDLAPMVDIESVGGAGAASPTIAPDLRKYLELIEQHFGVEPIIYTNASFWDENMDDSFGEYPLWVADYGASSPQLPSGWDHWVFWQHSESGSVPGISGAVDLDYFNRSLGELSDYQIP